MPGRSRIVSDGGRGPISGRPGSDLASYTESATRVDAPRTPPTDGAETAPGMSSRAPRAHKHACRSARATRRAPRPRARSRRPATPRASRLELAEGEVGALTQHMGSAGQKCRVVNNGRSLWVHPLASGRSGAARARAPRACACSLASGALAGDRCALGGAPCARAWRMRLGGVQAKIGRRFRPSRGDFDGREWGVWMSHDPFRNGGRPALAVFLANRSQAM